MTYINYDDALAQLVGAGLAIDKPLNFDSRIQRWKVDGEDNEKRGWSRLKEWTSKAGNTYIVGSYGVWHGTDDGFTKIELPQRAVNRPTLTDEDLAAMRDAQKTAAAQLAKERKAEAKTAGQWAATVWSKCAPAGEHEYTTRKGIKPHGLRVLESLDGLLLPGIDKSNWYRLSVAIGALVVPMHDAHGNVCGIQLIYPRGHERAKKIERDKEFWPAGMAMGGSFGLIGPVNRTGVLLVTEGYATAASLHEATGQPVAYAFSANNLSKAGKLLRRANPRLRLLFCADDDYLTDGNPGCTHAAQATADIELAAWIKPDFTDDAGLDRRAGKKFTDFNDLAVLTGLPLVLANQINARLDALAWRDAVSVRGGSTPQGAGKADEEGGRPRAMSVMPVEELVARFIPLDDGKGKCVFDMWTAKIAHIEQVIALLPAGRRRDDIKSNPDYIARGAFYIDQVGFDPSEKDPDVALNTWRGWPMQPKAGKCELLLEMLQYHCSAEANSDEVYRWLLCWMAYPLQNPGAKMASAVIMHGPQGTGKSMVFKTLARIYGAGSRKDYSVVLDQKALADNFNADWENKLFVLAEEVVTRQEMWQLKNELKELVTGDWIRIRKVFTDAYRQRNQINFVYLSNENQPLPLDNDDRRHLVVYTPPALGEEFYREIMAELEDGGVEAFYHHLLNLDLSGFRPKERPPMTAAKQSLIALSSPSEMRFITDWILGDIGLPICPCLAADLYAAYMKWCRLNGEARPRPSNQFHGAVARLSGWEKKKVRVFESLNYSGQTVGRPMVLPPAHVLQAAGTEMPPEVSAAKWLTDCLFDFANALSGENDAFGRRTA